MAICPYCKKYVNGYVLITEEISKKAFKFRREMYSCPHCDSVLGFASIG
jgi:hypothetical protein